MPERSKKFIALLGLLVDKGLISREEIQASRIAVEAEYLAACQAAGTTAHQELEDLLERL